MRIIEIQPLENGAHRNQQGDIKTIPDGYAIIPDDMECENFPFGDITVDESEPPVVTSWEPLLIPEEPEPVDETETEPEPTQLDRVEAQATYTAMMTDTLLEV